jgi:hypothetical protein
MSIIQKALEANRNHAHDSYPKLGKHPSAASRCGRYDSEDVKFGVPDGI